jgi:hypothetical protein
MESIPQDELVRGWRTADVYLRDGRIYVVSSELREGRGWIHSPPSKVLDEGAPEREIGAAVPALGRAKGKACRRAAAG